MTYVRIKHDFCRGVRAFVLEKTNPSQLGRRTRAGRKSFLLIKAEKG